MSQSTKKPMTSFVLRSLATASLTIGLTQAAAAQGVTFSPANTGKNGVDAAGAAVDFKNAKPLNLPHANAPAGPSSAAPTTPQGKPGKTDGFVGDGQTSSEQIAPADSFESQDSGAQPQQYGTSGQVYTTSRVNLTTTANQPTVYSYPYRATGKLFFKIGSSSYVCSASLVKRGIVVTAAHCVANYGKSQFYGSWQYVPAYNSGTAPFGVWTAATAIIKTSYYKGTDGCYQTGVICPNDVAIIVLKPQSGAYAGARTGWLGYGYNGWGFNGSRQALITQVGYPGNLDSGALEERTDSQGYKNTTYSNNTIIGSLMQGGSSGGPWVANLGYQPSSSTGYGAYPNANIVVGVTSWGYVDGKIQQQGASSFTGDNIDVLTKTACASYPAACQ